MKLKVNIATLAIICLTWLPAETWGQIPPSTPAPGYRFMFKDGEIIQAPVGTPTPTPFPEKIDKEGAERQRKIEEEYARKNGIEPFGWEDGEQRLDTPKDDAFELPADQVIPGCLYTRGFSFPDYCSEWDEKEQRTIPTFDADKDSQATLDALKKRHGISGEYNVIKKKFVRSQADEQEIN